MSAKMPKDFLWGGAIAAHQAEGAWNVAGRGMSTADVMTAGGNGIPVKSPKASLKESITRTMKPLTFITGTKKISSYSKSWA